MKKQLKYKSFYHYLKCVSFDDKITYEKKNYLAVYVYYLYIFLHISRIILYSFDLGRKLKFKTWLYFQHISLYICV